MQCACRYSISGIKLLYSDPIQAPPHKSHPLCKRLAVLEHYAGLMQPGTPKNLQIK